MASRKVRAEALNDLERYVAELPPCQPDEMTTGDAIRIALPQIHAMQSKGYRLDAIANVLSKNGIEVTARALKRYVQLAEAGRTRGARKPTRPARAACEPSSVPADARQQNEIENSAIPVTAGTVAIAREGVSSRTAAAETVKKEGVVPATPSRRSAFVSRKDTEDN